MPERFSEPILGTLRAAEEVEIETAQTAGSARHRTVIWVIVDPDGRVLIRSYRGATARWFREALAHPRVTLIADGQRIPATVLVATDTGRIEATTRGFLAKYPNREGLSGMVADDVLSTTLELVPR